MLTFTSALNLIVKKLKQNMNPQAAYLFGSFAYGIPREDSDLDILIIMESTEDRRTRQIKARRLLRVIHFPKDILVRTPDEIEALSDDDYAIESIAIKEGTRIL